MFSWITSWLKAILPLALIIAMAVAFVKVFLRVHDEKAVEWQENQDEKARVIAKANAEVAEQNRRHEVDARAQAKETDRQKAHVVRYQPSTNPNGSGTSGTGTWVTYTPVSEWDDNLKKRKEAELAARRKASQ